MTFRGLLLVLSLAMLLAFAGAASHAQGTSTTSASAPRTAPHAPSPAKVQGPGDVRVGVFLYSVQELDIARHTFRVSFNIWWRYRSDDFDPIASLQVVNARLVSVTVDDKRRLADGETYVAARVEATIERILDAGAFPFDSHRLRIEIESPYPDDYLRYVVDTAGSMLDPEVYSPGWKITEFALHDERKHYQTNFGLPEQSNAKYSRAVVEVTARHVGWTHAIDYFIGFITSVLICLAGFLVNPRLLPARATMIGTAVFAAVGNKYIVNSLTTDASFSARPVNVVVVTSFSMVLILLLTSIACERMIEAGNPERAFRTNRVIGMASACGCLLVTLYVVWIATHP
ncbi:MAG: hypothetical protein ABI537_15475 [Casimicrobiaceae bacterium]